MNTVCGNRLLKTSIHILDDDSLLNIFYYCRLALLDEGDGDELVILKGGAWDREYWWYKFVQVCRRWRYLIFGSVFHLGISLRCTYGAPIADMLEHSPPLPLLIDYIDEGRGLSEEDEKGIMLALQHRDRIRRIRLLIFDKDPQKFVAAIGAKFPMLEFLYLAPPISNYTRSIFPKTFQAPHLRHLALCDFTFPMVSTLLAPTMLVTLALHDIPRNAYFCPNTLLQWVSLMPHLQTLVIDFDSLPNPDAERQVLDMPMMTPVTLPKLCWFGFEGANAYLEALLPRITTPVLEKLDVYFLDHLTISLTNLKQFVSRASNWRFTSASFCINEAGDHLDLWSHEGTAMNSLYIGVNCQGYNEQVFLAAQMCGVLTPVFSAVEDLTLLYEAPGLFLGLHNQPDRIRWREVLKSFNNIKTLRLPDGLLWGLSHALQVRDGESPMELLPELKELRCDSIEDDLPYTFDTFLEARENAGCPVELFCKA